MSSSDCLDNKAENSKKKKVVKSLFVVGFYGISTFVRYLTPNPFLCK